ncbi:PepSY domain-containing protein [Sedimentimonas flavescens]|uniref:PepSY domain-containing protein n=1 Tax=Sedimentimonas flavescens TaxID=2851012 RepID=A0ABT2ZVI8_9RHOB|nr:PepSY domain-containing protein [Sedimentimonas flavescens]MBW0158348.1 PepSY domain-containing protein [Sedimentimonas flavescens]MCT2538888.1 PepSY domain-containing protein [Sedimentimonas flavescens]MCV2877750.1 PepSY domain-containing protein [Sedimentimonas flavescens]
MKRTFILSVAAAMFMAGSAFAEINTQSIIDDLTSKGFTRIEITRGTTQVKVEAYGSAGKIEVIYDSSTGEILKQEQERMRAGEDMTQGVSIRERDGDFLDDDDDDDDDDHDGRDDDDDHDDDHDDDDDDDSDDDDDDDDSDDDDSDDSDDDDSDDSDDD